MSLTIYIDVRCDDCNELLDEGDWTGAAARENARDAGWRTSLPGGKDLCPDCR